jgi:HEAT repeat protein
MDISNVIRTLRGRPGSFGRVALVLAVGLGGALGAGCGGISDCGDDGAKCAEMIKGNGERCAQAYQLSQGDQKRSHCEKALKAIIKSGAKAAVPGLIEMLKQPESSSPYDSHRKEAAHALAELGDKSAVDVLIESIDLNAGTSSDGHDKNANRSNESIAEALGALGESKACSKLSDLMEKSRDNYVTLKSLRALGQVRCKESIASISKIALKHENKFMRKNAVIALGDIGELSAVDTLIQMMFVEYQGVSFYREASFALFQLGPKVADALLEAMQLKNDRVNKYFETTGGLKETAIKAKCGFVLGDLRDKRAVQPLIEAFEKATAEKDPVLLIYAAAPLGALGDSVAVPVLKKQMLDLDASKRDPILRALNQLGDRSVVPDMISGMSADRFVADCVKQGLGDKDACAADKLSLAGAQKSAADQAGNLAGPEHLDAYKAAVEKENEALIKDYFTKRMKAVEAAVECKGAAACWVKKLKDQEPVVREKAAWELGRIKDASTASALAEALGDTNTFVRSAAILAYWAYGDKSAVPAIEKRLHNEEGSADFVKVNEDLRRLLVHLKR